MIEIKHKFAKFAFYVSGFLGICIAVSVFFIPYILIGFPIILIGYGLVWAYWIESRTTHRASIWHWSISLAFNLFPLAYGVTKIFTGEYPIEGMLYLTWYVVMCVGSYYSMMAVLRHNNQVTP